MLSEGRGTGGPCFWLRFLLEERLHLMFPAISTALGRRREQTSWVQLPRGALLEPDTCGKGFPSDFTQFSGPHALSKASIAEKTRSDQEAWRAEGPHCW